VNCELNSEPVFVSLPIKKLSKTQLNQVSLQFTNRVFGISLLGQGITDCGKGIDKECYYPHIRQTRLLHISSGVPFLSYITVNIPVFEVVHILIFRNTNSF